MIYLLQQSDKQKWYFEVDDEGIAYRQMLLEEGKESKVSNVKKHEFFLAEHELPLDDPELKRIPKEAFEAVWDEVITEQQPRWLENKKSLPLGTTIMGYLEVLYPQGVIVSIPDTEALGLAGYDECAAHSQQPNISKGLLVEAQITGYDEVNCWFLLGQPKVWGGSVGDMDVSDKPEIVQELAQMYMTQLSRSFPYRDSMRLKEDHAEALAQLEDECFNADFSEYCALIAGTVSYVVNDHTAGIPDRQLELLKKSFFERFPQYSFIEKSLNRYPEISKKMKNHECARRLLLSFLQSELPTKNHSKGGVQPMRLKLEGLTVLAQDIAKLTSFYRDVLGFEAVIEENHYAEFVNSGIRLAICSTTLMAENTNDHHTYLEERKGQAFELNFECDSPDAVHMMYAEVVSKGATGITAPKSMSWGHTTGFFADPEGNIHSIFAINPVTAQNG